MPFPPQTKYFSIHKVLFAHKILLAAGAVLFGGGEHRNKTGEGGVCVCGGVGVGVGVVGTVVLVSGCGPGVCCCHGGWIWRNSGQQLLGAAAFAARRCGAVPASGCG